MGHGSFNVASYTARSTDMGYHTKSRDEIFTQRQIHKDMNPKNVSYREARDSEDNPKAYPIVIALDVTGSMGHIPHELLKNGLPTIMETIFQRGVEDPQIMFCAIGDHEVDLAPLQISQFEASDELLAKWLENVWLEGGGGGNAGESYALPWYFAGHHTQTDAWEKRKQKGTLITIGDEPVLSHYPLKTLQTLMGDAVAVQESQTAASLLAAARTRWNVIHFHLKETYQGSRESTINGWKELMGDHAKIVDTYKDLPGLVADAIAVGLMQEYSEKSLETPDSNSESDDAPMML